MNAAAEEEINSSSNKEISTVDVNIETVSRSEDHPLSKNLAILKNSILPDLDQEFANEAELMGKMPDPNLAHLDNLKSNKDKHEPTKRRPAAMNKNSDNDGPSFLEEPEDLFLVRNKPSTLKCAVTDALNAWFECSSGDPDSLQNKQIGNYVDPQTGIRTIEIHMEVSKQNLEDHVKRINDIQANYKFNNGQEPKSKHSRNRQYSKSASLDEQVNDASDQVPLVKSEQTAPVQSSSQLTKLLSNLRLNDTATISPTSSSFNAHNSSTTSSQLSSISSLIALMKSNEIYRFQCWCRAFGGHRTVESRKATIELSFNGGWSDWTEWSECAVSAKCGRGIQRRFRYCNNPPPVEDGLNCEGESLQTNECFVPCNSNHHWSQWTQWSSCSAECKQVRSRQCKVKETNGLLNSYSSSDGCQGQDVESKSCTGGLCRKIDRNLNNKDHFGSLSRDNSIQGLNQLLHQLNSPSNIGNLNTNNILDRNLNRNTNQLPILPNYNDNSLFNQLPNNLNNNNLQNQPASPPSSNIQASSDQQQIFILCSLLATSLFFLLLLVLFILFKQRKRHFKNKNKATILQLDKLGSEEQQQMLLLMQQTQQPQSSLNRTSQPAQILINGNNRGYLQQPIANSNQPDLVRSDKMHLVTRLNPSGTMVDHLLIRNNELQQSNKKISPLNTINNVSNLQMLKQSNTISNSNASGSLTTNSVNSNPSHNSDEEHQLNTPKYNRNKVLFMDKPSPIFANKLNSNSLSSSFQNSPNKYLMNHQRQDSSNYAYKFEEPDYAEPILQSLQSSSINEFEKFEKFNKECKQSINSHSGSNRSPSDISDNYDQFENEHYEQQFYDECEPYENSNFTFKNTTNDQPQFREFIETDNLLIDNQDGYDSLEMQQNSSRRPPLPKTQPPKYTMQNQRFSNFNSPKHLTLNNYSNDAQFMSKKTFAGANNQSNIVSNGRTQMGLNKKSYPVNNSSKPNTGSTSSNNKFIEVS